MTSVSVIMNCHNGQKYLKKAIDSVYSQTFKDWEIIFFNNFSTDESKKIALSYDNRVKYFESKNLINLGEARKLAINHAKGKWIAFLDVDDYWYPNKLEIQLNHLENTDYILSYSAIDYVTESGSYIETKRPSNGSGNILSKLLLNFDINIVTSIFLKKSAIENKIEFNKNMQASEEYNFFMKMAYFGKVLSINQSLGAYRVSNNSLTNIKIFRWAHERDLTLKELVKLDKNDNKYKIFFGEAFARSSYYRACYYMQSSNQKRARVSLKKIKNIDIRYKILFYLSFSKKIWSIIHQRKIKIIITSIYNKLTFNNE